MELAAVSERTWIMSLLVLAFCLQDFYDSVPYSSSAWHSSSSFFGSASNNEAVPAEKRLCNQICKQKLWASGWN